MTLSRLRCVKDCQSGGSHEFQLKVYSNSAGATSFSPSYYSHKTSVNAVRTSATSPVFFQIFATTLLTI